MQFSFLCRGFCNLFPPSNAFVGISTDLKDDDDDDDDDGMDDVGVRDDIFRQRQRQKISAH